MRPANIKDAAETNRAPKINRGAEIPTNINKMQQKPKKWHLRRFFMARRRPKIPARHIANTSQKSSPY